MPKQPHSEKYTLPVTAFLVVRSDAEHQRPFDMSIWRVYVSRSPDLQFTFSRTNPSSFGTSYKNAFELRSEFLALRSPEDAVHFFERYGPFELLRDGAKQPKARSVRWSDIKNAISRFEQALTGKPDPALYEFLFHPLSLELRFRAPVPDVSRFRTPSTASIDDAAIVDCEDVVTALRASTFLTLRAGFKWKRCARKDCNNLFESNDRRKIYCSTACGHHQAVNKYNARQKAKRRKGK